MLQLGGSGGGPGGRCSPPVPREEGAGKVVHRPDDCRSIFNSQTVLSPRSLDSSSARRLNRNHHLMKEILSETRKASKPGAAPRESSAGPVVGPPGCAEFSDGSADFVRLSTCSFLSGPIKALVPVASRDWRQLTSVTQRNLFLPKCKRTSRGGPHGRFSGAAASKEVCGAIVNSRDLSFCFPAQPWALASHPQGEGPELAKVTSDPMGHTS